MRLTNYIRDAFIASVMDDVPKFDYRAEIEKVALDAAVNDMPPKVRAVYDDKAIRDFIETHHHYFDECGSGMCLPQPTSWKISSAAHTELKQLRKLQLKQGEQRDALEAKLKGIAYGATTRKALVAALPEFEKYLPTEVETSRNLPVIANVIADFMKAGWPKDAAP